ncbi:lysophospholipid acyltransferase family protein [Ruegeria sp.]|uniref:lysophospholipid acyltransferase family protein n=1 Tax=Ruegeria sp. TaxID=1879320 RepID=UPI003B58E10A
MRKLNYYWRVLATGISFSIFGLGSLVLGAIWFRLLARIESDPAELERRSQRGVSLTFNVFLQVMTVLGVARFHYRDMQNLVTAPAADGKGRLIIANHPTLIDVIALISRMPNVQCIVKHELFSNFFISPAVTGANYIRNDEDPEKLAQDCIDAINSGKSIVVFPEGTRTPASNVMKFHRGFAAVACATQCEIVPITITVNHRTLMKGVPWYRVPPERLSLTLTALPIVSTRDLCDTTLPMPARKRHLSRNAQKILEVSLGYPNA